MGREEFSHELAGYRPGARYRCLFRRMADPGQDGEALVALGGPDRSDGFSGADAARWSVAEAVYDAAADARFRDRGAGGASQRRRLLLLQQDGQQQGDPDGPVHRDDRGAGDDRRTPDLLGDGRLCANRAPVVWVRPGRRRRLPPVCLRSASHPACAPPDPSVSVRGVLVFHILIVDFAISCTSMYEVKLEKFSGPIAKLLELIQEKHLEITEINLAKVTDDFLAYVESLEKKVSPGLLADFVVVASSLLLMKSKVLLPSLDLTDEEEGDIKDLERRLKLYQKFKSLQPGVLSLWNSPERSYGRKFMHTIGLSETVSFAPPEKASVSTLEQIARRVCGMLEALLPTEVRVKNTIVTLQQKISDLTSRLQGAFSFSLKQMASSQDKGEMVVSFLAILHMFANKLVTLEQDSQFGDIIVKKAE